MTVHLDRGYDGGPTARSSTPSASTAPSPARASCALSQAGLRWVVERTHQWMNGYGKLRRRTEKRRAVVDFYLFLAAALVVLRRFLQRACTRYRWPACPTTRRLK